LRNDFLNDQKATYTKGLTDSFNNNDANLSGAFFVEANLRKASFLGADLSETTLAGADLTQASLMVTNATPEQLAKAKSLKGAIMPEGFIHE
jgi:uncharacterized protein YjbI with pentapeptide repeats